MLDDCPGSSWPFLIQLDRQIACLVLVVAQAHRRVSVRCLVAVFIVVSVVVLNDDIVEPRLVKYSISGLPMQKMIKCHTEVSLLSYKLDYVQFLP